MEKSWSCNIEAKGRWIRGLIGLLLVGLAAWLWFAKDDTFWAIGCLCIGLFSLIEALWGWCALRALGIKTPF
ncbi:MAG: DUF2892 domain-containing protein [Verrucomicrobiales bacterium]|nr:DUF2892 domain-containing protein [Verrucomicrobiales bacterium]